MPNGIISIEYGIQPKKHMLTMIVSFGNM